jgi:hypothetical protein
MQNLDRAHLQRHAGMKRNGEEKTKRLPLGGTGVCKATS